ncbi:Crp/Fnr family transcriptional regulator [Maritimibacter sp. 55A14]|uniref:Crp/Fnr family transcriptional regulator n=1 Tax=Maritimibacter sp. 55A14 TaxID=2174844 RepID=UPI000D618523|nr:Crp/Fnr family transcriptional regulator [Maritimibacter sp. 55A14]PWE33485.1 Crp/Fnr family transcriptional regulator [Maritimibacter sp. 55A14]
MATLCRNCPIRKRRIFAPMTRREVAFMERFKAGEMSVDAGTTLLIEGSNSPQLFTVLSGMGLRYKTMPEGRRQVVNFVLPGDFVGLQAGVMREMQHSVEASTPMRLCVFRRDELWSLFRDHPERAFDLTWLAAVEEHFLGESLAALGQLDAIERIARAFVKFHDHGQALDLVTGGEMRLPYTQQDLADALGLSVVHTNKTLRKLRDQQVASWQNGKLRVLSYERLCDLGQLDPERVPLQRPLI